MKSFISVILSLMCCLVLFAGCAQSAPENGETQTPSGSTGESAALPTPTPTPDRTPSSEPSTEPASQPTSEPASETPENDDQPIDMEAFLSKLVKAHPEAGAEALCEEMLKSPYFSLFKKQSVEFYWPYFIFGFKPEGVKEAYAVTDTSSEAVMIVVLPDDDADPAAVAASLDENMDKTVYEGGPDKLFVKTIEGKIFVAVYYGDMRPITVYAERGRDFVQIFRDYLSAHPGADCTEAAKFFVSHQKLGKMSVQQAEEGNLRGFGVWDEEMGWYKQVEISGFADGARFEPMMEPNAFMGYIFRVREGADVEAFARMLRENANLAYNVCTSVNTAFTEIEGDYVLFVMCNE